MFLCQNGLKIAATPLWLDASRRVDTCVVSHAHLDHAKKHQRILATDKTLRILKKRIGKTRTIELDYRQPYTFDNCTVTLFPAGHILGSAQVLVERDGVRLLYSGDFNLERSLTAESIEIPESDILIMESTYGKPDYRFPPRQQVEQQLIDFAQQALQQQTVPVVVGYVLGKSQEAMKILSDAGFELSVHGSVAALARIYEAFGVEFGRWQPYKKDEVEGKVLIIPRIAIQSRMVKSLPKKKIVFLSGWAVSPATRYRAAVDQALPLSDHADFDGLVEYARKVNAKKIYTTHGFKGFAKHLIQLGFDAEPLQETRQLSLF
ncbi:MAG: MBL fold metallo-hydrolase [bacterium]